MLCSEFSAWYNAIIKYNMALELDWIKFIEITHMKTTMSDKSEDGRDLKEC